MTYFIILELLEIRMKLQYKAAEIEDIKRMYDLKLKISNDEMNKLINKIEEKDDKLSDLKLVRHENEKLKIKIKLMFKLKFAMGMD